MPVAPEEDPRTEEVRVALALNGGVSLAIWMGGCAVELDCARRAHLAPEPGRSVYNGLCTALGRMLVIDVMSGASAGGINGALLAAAIRHRRRLDAAWMRDRWLELGDFERLMHRTSNPAPTSLMQGDVFARDLETTFNQLILEDKGIPPPGQEGLGTLDVLLDVATTDLLGERRAFRDAWDSDLVAREHRALFRFRRDADYRPKTLTAAARASASFPLAFEPRRIESATAALAGFSSSRWVIDGGLLNNAPIAAAIALIPTRPAKRQVRRWVCYLNADPPADVWADASTQAPKLSQILGPIVSLPRTAPFVDQLNAIERAMRRGELGVDLPALRLIALDLSALVPAATALLEPYRHRRRIASLEELLGDPAAARAALQALNPSDRLPWIPDSIEPLRGGEWQWGVRAAQRVLQLLLDVLRPAIGAAGQFDRMQLLMARERIDRRITALDGLYRALIAGASGSADSPVRALSEVMECVDVIPSLREGAQALFSIAEQLGPAATPLFGPGWEGLGELDEPRFQELLRRAVAIEVIARALSDDADLPSGQRLSFAQLTPFAPSPVFTGEPATKAGWSRPQDKLTGIPLAHFAAFHRRSWRANDFMWGRLDAAARVVDMLVSPERAQQLARDGADPKPSTVIAAALLPATGAGDDQRWLIHEALADFEKDGTPQPDASATDLLRERLAAAIERDLTAAESPGVLTRAVCTRAVQLEILADELVGLDEASAHDAKLGAGSAPLALSLNGALRPAIEDLREEPSLRERLTAKDEIASTLAIGTATRATLVSLGVLRASGLPLVRALFPLRALVLPIAGSVAHNRALRGVVVAAFTAAVLFLAARVRGTGKQAADLQLVWSWSAATAAIAVLVVVGVVLVPTFRGWRAERWKMKLGAWAWGLGLAASGLGPLLLGHWAIGLSWAQLIAAPADDAPPDIVLIGVVAFVVGTPLIAIPLFRDRVDRLLQAPWGGMASAIVALAVAVVLALFSALNAEDEISGAKWWDSAILLCPFAGALIAGLYLFWRWPRPA